MPVSSNKLKITLSFSMPLSYFIIACSQCTHFTWRSWTSSNVNSPTTCWQFLPNRVFKLFTNLYTYYVTLNNLLNFTNRLQSITSIIRALPPTTNAAVCFSSASTNDILFLTSISWTGLISFSQVKKFGPLRNHSRSYICWIDTRWTVTPRLWTH